MQKTLDSNEYKHINAKINKKLICMFFAFV